MSDGTGPVRAVLYSRPAGPGSSSAILVSCDDGVDRVVKIQGNSQGNRILVNELVVARLAQLLCAPCPRGIVVYVPQALIEEAKTQHQILATGVEGLSYGCEWVDVQQYDPGVQLCIDAENRASLIDLDVLYTWVRNSDLKGEHFLYRTTTSGLGEVYGFDHGHTFGSPLWDATIENQAATPFVTNRCNFHQAIRATDLNSSLKKLEDLEDDRIANVTRYVPEVWGASSDELNSLGRYLVNSRERVVNSLRTQYSSQGGPT